MEPIQDIPNFETFEYQYSKGKNLSQISNYKLKGKNYQKQFKHLRTINQYNLNKNQITENPSESIRSEKHYLEQGPSWLTNHQSSNDNSSQDMTVDCQHAMDHSKSPTNFNTFTVSASKTFLICAANNSENPPSNSDDLERGAVKSILDEKSPSPLEEYSKYLLQVQTKQKECDKNDTALKHNNKTNNKLIDSGKNNYIERFVASTYDCDIAELDIDQYEPRQIMAVFKEGPQKPGGLFDCSNPHKKYKVCCKTRDCKHKKYPKYRCYIDFSLNDVPSNQGNGQYNLINMHCNYTNHHPCFSSFARQKSRRKRQHIIKSPIQPTNQKLSRRTKNFTKSKMSKSLITNINSLKSIDLPHRRCYFRDSKIKSHNKAKVLPHMKYLAHSDTSAAYALKRYSNQVLYDNVADCNDIEKTALPNISQLNLGSKQALINISSNHQKALGTKPTECQMPGKSICHCCRNLQKNVKNRPSWDTLIDDHFDFHQYVDSDLISDDNDNNLSNYKNGPYMNSVQNPNTEQQIFGNNESDFDDNYSCCKEDLQKTELYNSHDQIYTDTTSTNSSLCSSSREYPYKFGMQREANDQFNNDQGYSDLSSTSHNDILTEDLNKTYTLTNHNNNNIEKEPLINDNHCGYRLAFDTQTTLSSIYSLNDFNLLQSCYNALGQPENMHNICGNNEKMDHLNMKYDIETVPDSTPFWQSWPPDLENPYSSARQKRIYNTFLKQKMSYENKSNILRTSKLINISLPMLTFTSNTNQQKFKSREDYRSTDKAPLTSDHIDPRQNIGNCNNFGIDKTQPSNYKETAPIIINKNCNDTISNINNFQILIKLALENFYQKNNSSAQSLSSAPQSPCKTTKNISTSFGKDNCDNHKDLGTVLACLSESLMLQMLNNLNCEATTNSADAEQPNSCDDQTVKHGPHETLYSKCPICQYLNGVANFEKNKIRQKPSAKCQANNDLNLMTGTLILSTLASLQLLKVTQESNNTKYHMGGNTNDEHQKHSYCSILPSSDDHNDTNYNTKMEISNDGNSLNNNFKDYPNRSYRAQEQNESTYSYDPNRVNNNNLNDNNNTSSILSLMESSLKLRFGDTFGPIDTSHIKNLTDPPFAKDHHNTTKKYGNHDSSYLNNLSITVNKVSPTQSKPAFKEIKLGAVTNFLASQMPENPLINGDSQVTSKQLPNLEFLREKWLKLKSFEENAIKSQHFTNFHQTNSRICNIPPNLQGQDFKDDITTDDYSNIDNFDSSNPIYEEVTDNFKNNVNNSQISSDTQSSDSFSHPSDRLQKDTTSTHTQALSHHSILKIKKTVSFSDKVCLHEISDSNITPYGTPERILSSGENKITSSTKFVFDESASDNFIEILLQLYTYFNLHSTLSLLFECENCDDLPSDTWESKLKMAINTNMNQLINLGDNRKHHNLSQFLINQFCQPLSTLILETMCFRGHSCNPANVSHDQCKRIDNQVWSNAHLWRQIKKLVDQTYTNTDTSVSINSNKLSIMNDLITAIEKNKHATTILESKYTGSQLFQEQSFLYAFICGLLNLKQLGHWIEAQFQMENEPSNMALSDNPILCKLLYSLKHLPFRIYLPAIINYPDSISMMTAKGNLEISINPNPEKNVPKRLEVKDIAINLTSSNCSSNESNYNNKIGKNCNYINKQPNNISHFNVPSSKNPPRAAEFLTSDQENFKGITTIADAKIDNETDAMSIFPCKIPKGIQRNPIPSKIPKLYPNRAYMSASSTIIESNLCNKLNSYKKAIGKNNEVEKKCSSAPISPVKDNKSIVSKYNNNGKIVNIWQNKQTRITDTITLNPSKLLLPNKDETSQQLSFIKNISTNLKNVPFPSENVSNVENENPSAQHLLNLHKSGNNASEIECERSYKPPIQALVIKYKPTSLLLKNTNKREKSEKNDEKSLMKDLTKTTSPPTNGFQKFRQDLNRRFNKKNVMPRPLSTNLTIPTKGNSNVNSNHSNTTNKSRKSYPTRTDGLHLHLTSNNNNMVANENSKNLANEKNIYIINANSFVNSKNSSSESGIGSSEAPNLA